MDIIKSVIYGIVEGITEWLPVSSTGHLILTQALLPFGDGVSSKFPDMYNYVIQLGAILAVVVLFWNKLWPFKLPDKGAKLLSVDKGLFKGGQWSLWFKILVAIIPSACCIYVDKLIETLIYDKTGAPTLLGVTVIALALIIYGILFIVIEKWNKSRTAIITSTGDITYKTAVLIGLFQVLAIIPGTSRSGATILGALIVGASRPVAAEFSFFLSIPTMVGVSGLKIIQFLSEASFSPKEFVILLVGFVVSFIVSMMCIKKLMEYVKRKNFTPFGYYRIILGIIVILYFALFK